jgi:type III secretory pathway component EscR
MNLPSVYCEIGISQCLTMMFTCAAHLPAHKYYLHVHITVVLLLQDSLGNHQLPHGMLYCACVVVHALKVNAPLLSNIRINFNKINM